MNEAKDAHRAMLQHAQAGEAAEALAASERYLELVSDLDDPELTSRTTGATATWLSLKARLEPSEELLLACDEIFERFREDVAPEAAALAVTALRVKIGLLLDSDHSGETEATAATLVSFYISSPQGPNDVATGNQLILAAHSLLAAQRPAAALAVARPVVDRLAGRQEERGRLLGAAAQVWVLLATMYSGARTPEAEVPKDLTELQSLSVEAMREMSPVIEEAEKLAEMGEDAVQAIDLVVRRLHAGGQWDRAIITALGMKIETLTELNRPDEVRAAKQDFINRFGGLDVWNVRPMVEEYKHDLQQA
jgi:hypothetical protein